MLQGSASEMTYTVSGGALNSTQSNVTWVTCQTDGGKQIGNKHEVTSSMLCGQPNQQSQWEI